MCPRTPPEPNTPNTMRSELQRLYQAAYELARLRAERALWANTIKALEPTGPKDQEQKEGLQGL